uniref:DENN/MADD domain containing 2C n=1 Tax=Astyanax mexicanus TaxID=7994 RepID=A0A8B9HXC1_ASTMX
MLALGVDYGKPGGGREGGRGGGRGRGKTSTAWQSPVKERLPARESGVNIKQKISQWEGLSQSDDGHGGKPNTHGTPVSRTLSGDVLGNGFFSEDKCDRLRNKTNLSKAISLGLDFRENQVSHSQFTAGRKSDPHQDRAARLNRVVTSTPVSKLSLVSTQTQHTQPPSNKPKSINSDSSGNFTDIDVTSLPQCVEDPEDSLPPGNFYTSRGFWRRLEGEESFWDKERDSSPLSKRLFSFEAAVSPADPNVPPPKPQRTFQYRGAESPPAHSGQWEKQTSPVSQFRPGTRRDVIRPPSGPPPPCPVSPTNGFSRNRRNRKSFEFEDVVRLAAQQGSRGTAEARRSGLYHARSEDSIYEDIIPDIPRENPYEDIKLSPMCLPIMRSRNWTVTQRPSPRTPKLPPKPLTLRANADRLHEEQWDFKHSVTSPFQTSKLSTPKPSASKHATAYRTQRQPQYVSRIQEIFQAKRGWKRVKSQTSTSRDELSGTESDPEDSTKGGSQRLVYVQSTLKRRPGYRTLERDLIQLQQEQLFQLFVVVSLRKRSPGNTYYPEVTQQFPTKVMEENKRSLKNLFYLVFLSELLSLLCRKMHLLEGVSTNNVECDLSALVSEAFVRFFVELVGHYSLHISETGTSSGVRELNRDAFRKSHPSRGVRQFLQLFMDTQMFAGFIQDRELRKGGVKGLFEVRAAEYLASCPEPEPSGVNKFLKGLGNKMKFLQKK